MSAYSRAWLPYLTAPVPKEAADPASAAAFELRQGLEALAPDCRAGLEMDDSLGDAWRIETSADGVRVVGGRTGVLYGVHALLESLRLQRPTPVGTQCPRYGLRMIDLWDNADGTVERGYAGHSLFFRDGKLDYDPERIRQLGRMLASAGLNVLCINNVNVHDREHRLLEDWLPQVAELASILRAFGVRLMLSIDFSHPLRDGLPTADPLDGDVRAWWRDRADRVYRAVPDLAGFLVKADSEHRPGPFTYGRTHADGANMLAEALAPHGGVLVWRCFVYNCQQDWRDTVTDRAMAAFQHYAPLDGQFRDNVILQVKHGPFDFQVREPVSPTLLAMPRTNLAVEFQLAQEYTGHQIDLYTMAPVWHEVFEDLGEDRVMAVAAVGNLGDDANWFGHPLAAFNLYGFGRFAWDPSLDSRELIERWVRLTYDLDAAGTALLTDLMLRSRSVYEKYTATLGTCWMVTPNGHYGPNPDGYEFQAWGTYHRADRNAVGIDRTHDGTGYLDQYPADFGLEYASPDTCPDNLLLFFHRLRYDYVMRDGRTLIQRIYDDHFEGKAEADALCDALTTLPLPEPDRTVVAERAALQKANAREWCDVVNAFFHRFCGVEDAHGRTLY